MDHMADRLRTDSYSRAGAETIQCAQIGLPPGEKHIVVLGFGGTVETKFVELVIHARFIEGGCPDKAPGWIPERQAVGTSGSIDVVRGLAASAAGHVFRHDIRLSGNMLFEIRQYRLQPQISQPSWLLAGDHRDGLALIKGRLRQNRVRLA